MSTDTTIEGGGTLGPAERTAVRHGMRIAQRQLGGEALVDYLARCVFLRVEPDPAEIARMVSEHQGGRPSQDRSGPNEPGED